MENLHPLVIGIRSQENYDKLKYMIGGISKIDSRIGTAFQYGLILAQNRRKDKHMSEAYINEKNQNTIQLLGLLPRITIPKGALIFHSNKFTSDMLQEASAQLERDSGWYPTNKRCQNCQILQVPYERVGESPRMNELLFNPNSWNYTTKLCECLNIKQHRMFGNFNFTGNYHIAVSAQMKGTHAYIVTEDINILDATYTSIELGYSIKNFSDIGDMQVVKQYCVENGLDGLTMFDTLDPQHNVETAGNDLLRGAENSCYKYKWNDDEGIQRTSYLCPEIVLFHNSNDSEWETLGQRYPTVVNIGTRKIKIMGMVNLVHEQDHRQVLSRDKVSNMFDILFSNYLRYVPEYNQYQVTLRTGKQIEVEKITIGYADTNIYKMLVYNEASDYDQNMLFELIALAWSRMTREQYCIKGDVPIDQHPDLKFFDVDQNAEELANITHLNDPSDWIKLYSPINIDFDLPTRLHRSPLYSSEPIFQRILRAHNIEAEKMNKLYIISCLTIIPYIKDKLQPYDIIDVLEGTVNETRIQTSFDVCINYLKDQCMQYFQQRNAFIFSKFNIPFILNHPDFYRLIQLVDISNSIPTFMFTKNIISFINTESASFTALRAYLLDPHIQLYNNKVREFFSVYSNQIMVIINGHFGQEIIQNSDAQTLLTSFREKFTQAKFNEFMTKIVDSYKILDYQIFMEDIDHMIIDLIKFFWDIFTDYITTTKTGTINGTPTKEYMDNLFITSQKTLYPGSLFYEVVSTDVQMYSPLYYHSTNKNIVYVCLENEIDINALWNYYYKNKDSDILDLIYELKEFG